MILSGRLFIGRGRGFCSIVAACIHAWGSFGLWGKAESKRGVTF